MFFGDMHIAESIQSPSAGGRTTRGPDYIRSRFQFEKESHRAVRARRRQSGVATAHELRVLLEELAKAVVRNGLYLVVVAPNHVVIIDQGVDDGFFGRVDTGGE